MLKYTKTVKNKLSLNSIEIESFIDESSLNIDEITVRSFGEEWEKFNSFSNEEIKNAGDQYFDIVDKKF